MASGIAARARTYRAPPLFGLLLLAAFALVVSVPRVSDIRMQRLYEIGRILPFEHPVLSRLVYVGLRTVADGPVAIAIVAAAVGVAAAVAVAALLRRADADVALWMSAPTLVLVGQNLDAVTCVFIVCAIAAWQHGRFLRSGAWLGVGAAFKVAPALLVAPIAASSARGRWRRGLLVVAGATAAWAVANVPYAVIDYDRWAFPYRFARLRDDVVGTVWAALPFEVGTVNVLSTVLLVAGVVAVCVAVAARRLGPVVGAAVAVALFLATNKVWQPHYVLWLLAVLAFVPGVPRGRVRTLELANLAYFAVYWVDASDTAKAPFIWLAAGARLAALMWLLVTLVRARPAATERVT